MDDAGNPEQVRSAAVGPVPERDNNEVMGTIEVSAQGGGMIEVHAEISGYANNLGDVDGLPSQSEERWQWLRNGQPIDGATDEGSYLVPVDDIGAEISLRLQFTDALGFEEELVSDQSDPVPNGPVIMAPNGYYFDDNEATVETLTVDFSRLDYLGMPTNRCGGGSVTFNWGLTALGGAAPTSFEYRYKPTALLPFTDADYWIALAGSGTRSLTLEGDLINNAPYTFEVRSKTALVDGVADYVEATYLHKTRACP